MEQGALRLNWAAMILAARPVRLTMPKMLGSQAFSPTWLLWHGLVLISPQRLVDVNMVALQRCRFGLTLWAMP